MDTQYKQLHNQFMSLIQNIPGTIYQCFLDEDWTIVFLSDHIYQLTGYPASDFMNNSVRTFASIIHPDDAKMVDDIVQEAVDRKTSYTLEYRIIHANGEIRWAHEAGQAMYYEDKVAHLDGVITDITEKKLYEKEIAQLAFFDPLTHLPNRRLLIDRLNQVQLEGERNKHFAALMFIDLDGFKDLNDTFGHDYGDLLLQQVANRLSTLMRKGDTVARLGGDEFIIVLKDLSECKDDAVKEVIIIADKIMKALNMPYELKLTEYVCTSSMGITFIKGREYDQDELIKQADGAMYDAKKSGKNTYRFFNR